MSQMHRRHFLPPSSAAADFAQDTKVAQPIESFVSALIGVSRPRTLSRMAGTQQQYLHCLKLGLRDGVELHFLYFTFGLDVLRPTVKTPFGRLGAGVDITWWKALR
jgi:hypothetical protein